MRRLTPNELVDRVPWEVGFDMSQSAQGDASATEAGAIGQLGVSFVTRSYWQYLVRVVIVIELDAQQWLLAPGHDVDDHPRVLRDLVAVSAQTDERRDLTPALRPGFEAPNALAMLDLFAAYEHGRSDTIIADCVPSTPASIPWPGSIETPPSVERIATTIRRYSISGTAGGWRQITSAVRLRVNAGEWSFERVPLAIVGKGGMALS